MATIGSIVIGMSVDNGSLSKGLKKAGDQVGHFSSSAATAVGGFGKALEGVHGILLGLAGAVAVKKIGDALVGAAKQASDFNEQLSKASVVFGPSVDRVVADAQAMGDAFGYPKSQFLDGASSIGLIAKASGLAQADAAGLGSAFARLAADASSFYNVSVEDALMAIRSGLVGEAEPMRRFGVLLNEAAVKSEAVRLGLAKMGAELTEGQKVQARSSLIMKGLADASGDLARTADSAANRVRSIAGRLENLGADVGAAIQPATDAILGLADVALKRLGEEITNSGASILGLSTNATEMSTTVFAAFERIGTAVGVVLDVVHTLKVYFLGAQAVVADLFTLVAKLANIADRASDAVYRMTMGIDPRSRDQSAAFLDAMGDGAAELHKKFQDALVLAPPSEGIKKFFDDVKTSADGASKAIGGTGAATKGIAADMASASAGVAKLEDKLRAEIATIGKSSEQSEIYKLKLAGVSDAQLKTVRSLAAQKVALDKAQDVIKETRTPLEQYQKKMTELRGLLASGAIDKTTFARASTAAKTELAGDQPRHAAALELGSTEARSSILKFRGMNRGDDSIKSVAKNTEKQVDISSKMNDGIHKIAAAIGDGLAAAILEF